MKNNDLQHEVNDARYRLTPKIESKSKERRENIDICTAHGIGQTKSLKIAEHEHKQSLSYPIPLP